MKKPINVSGLNFIFHMNIAVSWDIRVAQNVCLSLFEAGDRIHIDCPGSCLASLFEPTWCGSSTCRCHHSSVPQLRFGPLLGQISDLGKNFRFFSGLNRTKVLVVFVLNRFGLKHFLLWSMDFVHRNYRSRFTVIKGQHIQKKLKCTIIAITGIPLLSAALVQVDGCQRSGVDLCTSTAAPEFMALVALLFSGTLDLQCLLMFHLGDLQCCSGISGRDMPAFFDTFIKLCNILVSRCHWRSSVLSLQDVGCNTVQPCNFN